MTTTRRRTSASCYFLGRRTWLALPSLWLFALAAGLWLWPVAMLFDSLPDHLLRGISAGEAAGIACLIASAWCLAPRMPTWEMSAPRRPRVWTGASIAALLTAYAALGPLTRWLLYTMPPTRLPTNASGQTARSQFTEPPTVPTLLEQPRILDVIGAGVCIIIAIGLLGQVIGTLAGTILYAALIWAQGDATLCQLSPYGLCLQNPTNPGHPTGAITAILILAVAATAAWTKTGGRGLIRPRP
jgi:hypothetical protein